jgi:hypothetical protein
MPSKVSNIALKSMSANECLEKLFTIVDVILPKWPAAKIIVSGTTPREDDTKHSANGRIINSYSTTTG